MKHDAISFYGLSCQDRSFDDYLLLGGGTDINPKIYGQEPSPYTQHPNNSRDTKNIEQINKYVAEGKPIFGICRGFQLLDAVFGGQLIQHTDGHPNGVTVNVIENKRLPSTSIDNCRNCHHQVVNDDYTKGEILGESNYVYMAYDNTGNYHKAVVPQIIYWEDKKALAVQFHPEWHRPDHKMNVYLRGLIKELLGLENVL